MPIRILRSFIEQVLPHSPTIEVTTDSLAVDSFDEQRTHFPPFSSSVLLQVCIYDANQRLLNDTDRLKDISCLSSSSLSLRFTMMNTITSLGHCTCASLLSLSSIEHDRSSSSPPVIRRETIDRTLSTCPFVSTPPHSPFSSLSSVPNESSMSIVNLLTPPSPSPAPPSTSTAPHYSSFLIDNLVESNSTDQSIIDQITSEFGEICPSTPRIKGKRQRATKKSIPKLFSSDTPLDLTLKKRPSSSVDLFSMQSKWLKMI
jgi:hypothetical protein